MQRISITNPQNVIDGTAKKYYFRLRNTGGPKGDKGDKGDTGATGPQGPQGNAATVSVGSTTTLPVGYDATVTNTGSIYNAVLDFGIPQGPQGPQGAKGDKGDTGAKGDTGPRGPQGEKGTNATVYVGTTSTLAPGSQATVYNSGSDSNAVLNFGIPQGAKGDTGSQGPQGPAGQNFAPTVVAELPATGDESKLYLTPKAHTSQTATGNPITATVSDGAGSMESFQLDGDTFQQTYTGKNLLAFSNSSFTSGGVTSVWENGKVAMSGTATSKQVFITGYCDNNLSAGIYTFSMGGEEAPHRFIFRTFGANNQTIASYQLEQGSTSVEVTISGTEAKYRIVMLGDVGYTYSETDYFQLEAGSTATAYEPYVGGIPAPNPDYPQPIQTVTGTQTVTIASINLFDGVFELGNISTTTGVDINADTMIRTKNYAVIEGGENYTISVVGGGSVALRFYQSDGTFIGTGTTAASPNTFTAPANAGRVRFIVTSKTNLSTKAQCEKGSSATDWTPYYGPYNYPLGLGSIELCKLGTYQDYIYKDGEDWKIHKAIKKSVFDQNSRWTKNKYGTNAYNVVTGDIFTAGAEIGVISPQFIAKSYNDRTDAANNIIFADSNDGMPVAQRGITVRNTAWSDLTSFITWVTSNPVTAYYVLATATDTAITNQALIDQLEAIRTAALENGANTISNAATGSNLAGDMEISYYGYNPTNRYDKWLWLDINNEYEQIGS